MYTSATSLTMGYRRRNCMAVRVVESRNLQPTSSQPACKVTTVCMKPSNPSHCQNAQARASTQ